jgi:peptidoglycan/LPS O-acetylase OafA/YrhL
MKEARPFFDRVESLRGLGAVAVAGWHLSGWGMNGVMLLPHVPWESAGAAQNVIGKVVLALIPAHAALMMFFAISGFVLYVSLSYGPQTFGAAGVRFAVARFFRIYPIVIFAALLAALLHGGQTVPSPENPTHTITFGELVANFLLLNVSINPTLWALQVEVLMVPIIVLLYFAERAYGPRVLLAIGLITTALAFAPSWAIWPPLSTNLFAFVLGMLIPTLGRQWASGLTSRAANTWLLVSVVVLFGAGPLFGFFSRFSAVFEAYASLSLLSIVAYRADFVGAGFLENRHVRRLGAASGSYYVLHMLMFMLPMAVLPMVIPASWSAQWPALIGPLVIVVSLIVLVPMSMLSYRLVEAPGIAFGSRLLQRRRVVAAE